MDYRLEQLRFELREDPSSRIFFKLGEHLRREGELQEAIEVLSGGLEKHPKYVAAWVCLGRALLDAGASREASDALGRAMALDPENAVATRFAGEAAIANGDWVEAIKALKRTRAMSGPDEVLDERIQFVESHLAEMGQLEGPGAPAAGATVESRAPGRSLDQVFADTGDRPEPVPAGDDVFVVESADGANELDLSPPDDGGRSTVAVPLAEMPLPGSDAVSFADVSVDDAGDASDAVFEIDADALSGASIDELGDLGIDSDPMPDSAGDEGDVFEIDADGDVAVEIDVDGAHDFDLESATQPLPVPELEATPVDEPEPDLPPATEVEARSEDLPLPTMTLARLALDQGDLELAEKTLRGVLEREPDHVEANELLAGLTAGTGVDGGGGDAADGTGDVRAQALRRWLEAVRLASERLKP